jgi:membrane-associated phospholipid phosphatase
MRARLIAVGAAVACLGLLASVTVDASVQASQSEPRAGSWRPWVLTSGKDVRLPAPPDARVTAGEMSELRTLAAQRDAGTLERIRYWDFWSPAHRWNEILTDTAIATNLGSAPGLRAFAMLNVAIHDATIAAWDSKYSHGRRRPAEADRQLTTAIATPPSPSYPCEHSVAAGAAAAVLSHLFPADAPRFAEAAQEASRTRMQGGVAYASDAKAGLELGRVVAARVIEFMKLDGQKWAGTVPTGPGLWVGTNPIGIDEMRWKTFVLTSASQLRSPPPPAVDSPERAREVAEVKNFKRTPLTNSRASYWQTGQHGQAGWHYLISREVGLRLAEQGLDRNPPRASRAYALAHVTSYDTYVASQDTKFHYWIARPNHFDPSIATVVTNPPFPSYPSNAAALGAASAAVLGHLFPREAPRYQGWAQEFGDSRLWAGIHFKSDIEAGFEMGRRFGALVIERAKGDGAE